MMRSTHPALRALSESLAAVVAAQDEKRLRELLRGRALPALGGDLPPSEILRQALYQATETRPLALGLAALLARVVRAEIQALARSQSVAPDRRRLLLNELRLAAELPAQPDLFRALRNLLPVMQPLDAPLFLALWEALSYQQTDSSLESVWLRLLQGSSEGEEWTPTRRTLLLVAWRGLLWIPPGTEPKSARGQIVSFDRIESGLLALASSVRGHEEAEDLLREALETLNDTFPRSTEFWAENLRPRIRSWPEDLQEMTLEIWPGLLTHDKIRILFLSSSPAGSELFDGETRQILADLQRSASADRLELRAEPTAHVQDLPRYLVQHEPHILHFAGHGPLERSALFELQDGSPAEQGQLAQLLEDWKATVHCVVLNACFSAAQAEPIAKTVGAAIALPDLTSKAAVVFAEGFYEALAFGSTLQEAFELGSWQLDVQGSWGPTSPLILGERRGKIPIGE